jgi:hypothetical protein
MPVTRSRSAGSIVLALVSTGRPGRRRHWQKHIDAAPSVNDTCYHGVDRLMVADVEFDAQCTAAGSLDLCDRALDGHVLCPGVELPVRLDIEIGDPIFAPSPARRRA